MLLGLSSDVLSLGCGLGVPERPASRCVGYGAGVRGQQRVKVLPTQFMSFPQVPSRARAHARIDVGSSRHVIGCRRVRKARRFSRAVLLACPCLSGKTCRQSTCCSLLHPFQQYFNDPPSVSIRLYSFSQLHDQSSANVGASDVISSDGTRCGSGRHRSGSTELLWFRACRV